MPRRSRARHKNVDARIVMAAFTDDPRISQERALMDVRRQIIVGDGADPVLSSCPLDIMYARRVQGADGLEFSNDHKAAAEWFLRLYRYRYPCKLKGALDDGMGGGAPNDNPQRDAEYRALCADRRMNSDAFNLLADVLVFQIYPDWLREIIYFRVKNAMPKSQIEFMTAIDALRKIWLEFAGMSMEALRARCSKDSL